MKQLLSVLLIVLPILNTFAQPDIKRSNVVIKQNGKAYYVHTIKQGHTLYSLSKVYNVGQKEIMKVNAMYSANLKVGQKLKIPAYDKVANQVEPKEADFFYHKVKHKETLYSIAKKYNIGAESILAFNPGSRYGIRLNQVLTIPNVNKGQVEYRDNNFFYHKVSSGETLFSISQQYGTSLKQIQLFNPETKKGLQLGSTIKIPKTTYDNTEKLPVSQMETPYTTTPLDDPDYFTEAGVTPCFDYNYRPSHKFKVALFLPLYIEKNKWVLSKYDGIRNKNKFFKNSGRFIEMYEGMLLAVNQMKYKGLSIDLHVFDTKNNETEVRKILSTNDLSNFDLIIGPLYSKNISVVGRYARRHKINIVSPLSQNQTLIFNNPFLFQVVPSTSMRIKKTSDLISKLYDSTIVIVHNGTEKEKKHIETYKQKLVKSFASRTDINEITLKTVDYNFGGKESIEDAFTVGSKNIVLIPADEEVFVTKVVEQLFLFAEDYDIELIGSPNWELYQNIKIEQLRRMSFNYASPYFIDYDHWRVKNFIKKFRKTYETEPSIYAFEGYDIGYYFLSALMQYGKNFQFCLSANDKTPNKKGIVFDFNFIRTGFHNGYENNGVHFVTYDRNYKLKKTKIQ
ncbi:MAG: LysM peptidoglycan-binding domain-containing protein [Bacteroidota bacterium]|nr:LysM peptidoglycan-binding domain-containing protein [Bacteroidota bacterium]